jgi:hypothetical protein
MAARKTGRTASGMIAGDDTWTVPIIMAGTLGILALVVWRRQASTGVTRQAELATAPTPLVAMGQGIAQEWLPVLQEHIVG